MTSDLVAVVSTNEEFHRWTETAAHYTGLQTQRFPSIGHLLDILGIKVEEPTVHEVGGTKPLLLVRELERLAQAPYIPQDNPFLAYAIDLDSSGASAIVDASELRRGLADAIDNKSVQFLLYSAQRHLRQKAQELNLVTWEPYMDNPPFRPE